MSPQTEQAGRRLRVAVVGCGYIAQAEHIPQILLADCMRLVAVVDQRYDLAVRVGDAVGVAPYADLAACLDELAVDAVVICSPPSTHVGIALEAIRRGKHVLMEKPLCDNVLEGERLVQAAEQSRVKVAVGYMRRHDTDCCKIKALIDSGELGEVHAAVSMIRFAYRSSYPVLAEFKSIPFRDQRPAGPLPPGQVPNDKLLDQSVHHLNLFRFLLGEVESVEYVRIEEHTSTLELRFRRGTVLTHHHLDGMGHGEEAWLFGSNKSVWTRLWSPHFPHRYADTRVFKKELQEESELILPRVNPYRAELMHFARAVLHDEEPVCSAGDALADLKLIQAIHAASRGVIPRES